MTQELALPTLSTVQLISNARRALAEARTLPDFRHVMEAATVAADAAKRAAKLMEAQGVAAEVVRQANEAANDAAAVRIEAQAGAGRVLRQMEESGGRRSRGGDQAKQAAANLPGLTDLIGERPRDGEDGNQNARARAAAMAKKWEQVAGIADNVRVEYVDKIKEEGGEITTAGLLRFAAKQDEADDEPDAGDEMIRAYDAVMNAMTTLRRYRAGAIAAYATDSRRKTHFRKAVEQTRAWVESAQEILQ